MKPERGRIALLLGGLLALSLWLAPLAAEAGELGMKIIGDDDREFGLFIAKWLDDRADGLPAPGFIDEKPDPVDPRILRSQRAVRQAMDPAAAAP